MCRDGLDQGEELIVEDVFRPAPMHILKAQYIPCFSLLSYKPEMAVPIVLQWSKENPVRTRMVDFMEKHPTAPLNEKGYPKACAKTLGYVSEEKFCRTPCGVCWETDVEDE